jgi:tetratricopeptide (TPR) repeat protein
VDLRLTADETMLVARHKRGQVVIWDIASGVGLPLPGTVGAIGLSSDGRLLALGDDGGNVWRVTMPSPTAGARGEGEWTPFEPAWKPLAPVNPPSPTSARERADRDARDAMAQRAAGDDSFRRGSLDDAVTYYRRAVAAGDADSGWRLAVVDAHRTHREDPNAAMRAAVVRVGLETPWTSTAPIDMAVAAPDIPAATRTAILRAWTIAAGDDATNLTYMVYHLIRGGELELARQVAERLLRVADEGVEFDSVAEVFNARGEAARAIALSERAVALDPKDEVLRANLRRFRRARRELGADVFRLQEPTIGPYTPARVPLPTP